MNWLQKMSQVIMNVQDVLNSLQQNAYGYFKYVKCAGQYRFSDATGHVGHKILAGRDVPESAGFVKISPEGFYIEGYSSILKIGPDSFDVENLSRLLSLPEIEEDWYL